MKNIITKIDKILSAYLGVEEEKVLPTSVKFKNGHLFISNTESFRRYAYIQNWDEFTVSGIEQTSQENKEKLGIAVGKVIAKNLVVSFDEIQIEKEKIDA